MKRCFLRVVFSAIQFASRTFRNFDAQVGSPYTSVDSLAWFLDASPDTIAHVARKQVQSRSLTRSISITVSSDRDAYIDQLARKVVDAQDPKAFATLWPSIKRLAPKLSKFGLSPVLVLQLSDGSFASIFGETGRRWCEHFSSIEHGYGSSYQEILQKARHSRYSTDRIMPQLCSSCFVSWLDLEQQFLSLNPGKATGPDKVPPEVLKCCSTAVTRALTPLSFKMCGLCSEPYQWSGGTYHPLYKNSGPQHLVVNSRAILLSDIMGKVCSVFLALQNN